MPHVRSVSIGVWLARGSRHESEAQSGIAHFVEHMLFKGTANRSAEDIAQSIDSIGGQMDAFTAKEYASYYIKVLDEHLPLAMDVLADIVLRPAFTPDDIEREKKVVLEEIKMVEDTPDDLVHELFTEHFWRGHPLGRPILGTRETVEALTSGRLRTYFEDAYTAGNMIIAAVGNVEHAAVRDLVSRYFGNLSRRDGRLIDEPPPDAELRRAKDHLKGSLMLNLESTSSRMSHLARQEIYFDRQFGLDETLDGVERVTREDVQRVARDLFADGALAATVLGAVNGLELPRERLSLG